ncbi:hypothetical protein MA16_Dca002896 [Dendrobium catenatum]|uniref:Uncharacterized protein n=1 Tax=Dendrobium catenatum TaxID=906689 RepID=A0A2I0X8Z4_9ASPA|nr:hypothetical protein MA16_Dca002896 [Dendrobium catenatum]
MNYEERYRSREQKDKELMTSVASVISVSAPGSSGRSRIVRDDRYRLCRENHVWLYGSSGRNLDRLDENKPVNPSPRTMFNFRLDEIILFMDRPVRSSIVQDDQSGYI